MWRGREIDGGRDGQNQLSKQRERWRDRDGVRERKVEGKRQSSRQSAAGNTFIICIKSCDREERCCHGERRCISL